MDYLKKFYHVRISSRKSIKRQNKQSTLQTAGDDHLLSGYSDDEETVPTLTYREKTTQNRRRIQPSSLTLDRIMPKHTKEEKGKSSSIDQKVIKQ